MSRNYILEAVAKGRPSFGVWQTCGSAVSAELLGRQGFDWILIDTQHGSANWGTLLGLIQAIELGGSRAVVRVGSNDPRLIMRALDFGALGVIVPMVSTVEQAHIAAAAARYPPAGERSFGPTRNFYSVSDANNDVLCIAMIETREGLENVEAIASTPGIDGLFVGPIDLALALNLPLSMTISADVFAAIGKVAVACQKAGIIAGSVSTDGACAERLIDMGVCLITLGSDVGYITRGARQDLELAKTLGDRSVRGGSV